MSFIRNLFIRYQSFVLRKIPHNVRKSRIFFFGLLALALPATVALALTQQDIRQRASEIVTPPIPPAPVINGFVYNDANGDGIKGDSELGIANVEVLIYKVENCDTVTPCPTPAANNLTTDTNGAFSFQTADAGTYSVKYSQGVDVELFTPTNELYVVTVVPPDQTVNFGFTNKPVTPTPLPTPSPTVIPETPTPSPTVETTPTITITPTTPSTSPTPTPSVCTKVSLKQISYESSCRKGFFFFSTKGNRTVKFTCTDGFQGEVGNSKACNNQSALKNMAEKECSKRCQPVTTPTILKGDLNLDGQVNIGDYNILLTCFSKRKTCDAKQNPDVNSDGKVNELDILAIQRIMFNNLRRR